MTAFDSDVQLQAPTESGGVLCVPEWNALEDLLATSHATTPAVRVDVAGSTFAQWRVAARAEFIAAAFEFTRQYTDVPEPRDPQQPIVASGHQPELVHPGVWLKNFAAAELSRAAGGTAVHLAIDSDLCRSTSVRVPAGSPSQPRTELVAFDAPARGLPYEASTISDRETWRTFGDRVVQTIRPFIANPLIRDWWAGVVAQSRSNGTFAHAIAAARHELEIQWGPPSLQLPMSKVCQLPSFAKFAALILVHADEFRTCYNGGLTDYRQRHRLKNQAQPMPDLVQDATWCEVPFWIWTNANPARRALFVRHDGRDLTLSDRHGWEQSFPSEANALAAALVELPAAGIQLRTRALLTTMFARLALCDLFIHGIGGAKYDQATNDACRKFFGDAPPPLAALSGTLTLPIKHAPAIAGDLTKLRTQLRELRFHPELFVDHTALSDKEARLAAAAIDDKLEAIRATKTLQNAADRHRRIEAANASLAPLVGSHRKLLESELADVQEQLVRNRVFDSREMAFCLFPQEMLREFQMQLSE